MFVHVKFHPAKPAFLENVLYGAVLCQAKDVLMKDIRLEGA